MLIELLLAVTFAIALIIFLVPDAVAARLAAVLSLLPIGLSALLWLGFTGTGNALLGGQIAHVTDVRWLTLSGYELYWFVGVDGISLPLVVLTTVLTTLAIVSAWTPIDNRQSEFYGLMLFMEAALLGVFTALDFFVWFVFWEAVLVPMYLLIGIWGGPERRYAAIKFFVYTNVASLVMFIAFIAMVFSMGDAVGTFRLPAIAEAVRAGAIGPVGMLAPGMVELVVFVAIFIGFAVKVPVAPLHTWLPDAHVQAPTPVSVMLAGVLLKMGTYALLRFNFTMFPDAAVTLAVPIAAVAVISVIYGALLALAQTDLKRVVAYSSVSSMGYVILGLVAYTSFGIGGATFQMVAHGLISGLMFMAVGVIYNVTHTREIAQMSGVTDRLPVAAWIFVAGAFGYMGLPLMAGFAAEFFIFKGAFASTVSPLMPLFTALAMFGIVIVAGYLLFAMQRSLFGPFSVSGLEDLERAARHDVAPMMVLLALIIVLGVAPEIIFGMIQDAVQPLLPGGMS
jgi:NADH-quinone oxidoreductase subunit M